MTIEDFRRYLSDFMTHGTPISLKSLINTALNIEDATAMSTGYCSVTSKKNIIKYIKEEKMSYISGWMETCDGVRIYNALDIRLYYRKGDVCSALSIWFTEDNKHACKEMDKTIRPVDWDNDIVKLIGLNNDRALSTHFTFGGDSIDRNNK